MREVQQALAEVDGGLEGDVPQKSPERGITFISIEQWREVMAEMGLDLPWYTRRANVLVEGMDLAGLVGRTVRVGQSVLVEILGESEPCGLMTQIQPGLREALTPQCRGGVYGRVRTGGTIAVGDVILSKP